ncbi:hypothetical protein TNCT_318011 [Trichonephila clavata]|uniref:Uncharacterized protein n=1 Tax=Trichonephila clavata TaxID=2740835 RepID=A0A8X6H5Y0_TRICU|nr:hypothetical protein TNCT_318011 [Trichonephila clavata]
MGTLTQSTRLLKTAKAIKYPRPNFSCSPLQPFSKCSPDSAIGWILRSITNEAIAQGFRGVDFCNTTSEHSTLVATMFNL